MKYLTLLIRALPILMRFLESRRNDPTSIRNATVLRPLLQSFVRASAHFELKESDWLRLADLIRGYIEGTVTAASLETWFKDLSTGRKPLASLPAGYVVHRPLRSNTIIRRSEIG